MRNRGGGDLFTKRENRGEGGCSFLGEGGWPHTATVNIEEITDDIDKFDFANFK